MGEFYIREFAERSPTRCVLCGTHVGPFIDTNVELPVHGWVYICIGHDHIAGCLEQIARIIGFVPDAELSAALKDLELLRADKEQLEVLLEESNKVIPISKDDLQILVTEWGNVSVQTSIPTEGQAATATSTRPRTRKKKEE